MLISLTVYIRRETDAMDIYIPTMERLNLFNAKYELDSRPIEEGCRLSGLPEILQSLYPSSVKSEGDAGHASLCTPQSVFL